MTKKNDQFLFSVIAGYTPPGSNETSYISSVKGAPETLRSMFKSIPEKYDEVYLELSRRGARVLALGTKELGKLSSQELREMSREDVEKNLVFVGFVIISCPLKADSKAVIKELQNASHRVVMITGDNPLTACHVSKELKFTNKPILNLVNNSDWEWESIDQNVKFSLEHDYKTLTKNYDLCITGEGLTYLSNNFPEFLKLILPYVTVFARFAPKQKEFVVVSLNNLGYKTLMCGDGTNDVGALKHADCGVAILSNAPERMSDLKALREKEKKLKEISQAAKNKIVKKEDQKEKLQQNINRMLKEMEEQDGPQIVKLGDASIASPFTSRLSSIMCGKF